MAHMSDTMARLQQVFLDFTSFGAGQAGSSEMDSAKFVKLAKDCKLTGKRLSTTDLDLIFTRVKAKTAKKIDFNTFVDAIHLIAEKTARSAEEVAEVIVSAKGPKTGTATLADDVRFHDDKSTFTGVHVQGGPSQIDRHNVDMSRQLDRSDGADVRGVMDYNTHRPAQRPSSPSRRTSEEAARRGSTPTKPKQSPRNSRPDSPRKSVGSSGGRDSVGGGDTADLEQRVMDVFVAFSSSVAKSSVEMDSSKFFKLMGDSGLTGKSLSRTDCDLMFTKTCAASGCVKKISYQAFRQMAIPFVAAHLRTGERDVLTKVACVQGISSSGTVAQASRFHDDKGTYTGSHAAGGPTHVDHRVSLESLADRSSADVRGVQPGKYEGADERESGAASRGSVDYYRYSSRQSSGSVACGSAAVGPMPANVESAVAAAAKRASRSGSSSTSPDGRRKSSLAEAGGAIAGSSNKSGGVFDRLCDKDSFTGVYAERFKGGGGRINGDTANGGVSFSGNTNSGGDAHVRDLSHICNRG